MKKLLEKLVQSVNKNFPGVASLGTDVIYADIIDSVSTGCTPLDCALIGSANPKGGLPYGRMIEIFGDSSEGKSTLAESVLAQNSKKGGIGILLLTEGCIDKKRLEKLGVDLSSLVTLEVSTIEDGFDSAALLVKQIKGFTLEEKNRDSALEKLKDLPIVIVWDSISQCTTRASFKSDDPSRWSGGMADVARAIREKLRVHSSTFSRGRVCFIFVSQTIKQLGMWGGSTTPGGSGIKFASSIRMEISRTDWIDGKSGREGIISEVNIVKSKVSVPFRKVIVPIRFETGIDNDLSLWYALKDTGIFKSSGGWNYVTLPDGTTKNFRWADYYKILDTSIGENKTIRDYLLEKVSELYK